MNLRSRLMLVLAIVLVGIGVDQATKEWARRTLPGHADSYLADTFRLQYSENEGAFLSLGSKMSDSARFWIFTVLVGVTMLLLAGYTLMSKNPDRAQRIAFALILSGGTSNLIDRAFNDGRVVDFLNVGIGSLRTGIFNIADMAILGGCLYLIFFGNRPPAPQPTSDAIPPP